jgi:hypothetical protein
VQPENGDEAQPPSAATLDRLPLTAGVLSMAREGPVRTQRALRVASHPGFDRIALEFDSGVPGYHLEYVDRPVRDCAAGRVVPIAGDGWLELRLDGARAHTEAGQPTIAWRELEPDARLVLEVERTCDFEGVVTWVVGVRSPNRFRVFELDAPPRLVVDVVVK